MEIITIKNSIYDSNSYLICHHKQCFMVDPSYEPKNLLNYCNEHQLKPVGILLTHCHNDHIYGIAEIKQHYDIAIYCTKECSRGLNDPFINLSYNENHIISINYETVNIDEDSTLYLAGVEVKVVRVSGHSKGCVIFECADNLLTGDFLFKRRVGTVKFNEGNYEKMLSSINKFNMLYKDKNYIIYPGHGESSTVKHELATNPFLRRPKSVRFLS